MGLRAGRKPGGSAEAPPHFGSSGFAFWHAVPRFRLAPAAADSAHKSAHGTSESPAGPEAPGTNRYSSRTPQIRNGHDRAPGRRGRRCENRRYLPALRDEEVSREIRGIEEILTYDLGKDEHEDC